MNIWLNNELNGLEDYFGEVARNDNSRNDSHYNNLNWWQRGKEENKLKNIIENGNIDDIVLYRYIPISQLWKLISNKELTLVNPSLWKDPLESPLFNARIKNDNEELESPFKNRYFAQCFTLNDSSESMWKTYTNGEHIARIKTTVGDLKKLVASNQNMNSKDFYLGRMVYLNFEDIKVLFESGYLIQKAFEHGFSEDQAKTLLVKRYAYAFEKEIRLIFDAKDYLQISNKRNAPKIINLNIPNLSDFIHEILFDPEMKIHDLNFYKQEFEFIANHQIKRCNLYNRSQYQLKL